MRSMFLALVGAAMAFCQAAEGPRFEVASIKPSPLNRGPVAPVKADPARVVYNNMSAKTLIQVGYKLPQWRISGGPDWMDSQPFDLAATLPPGSSSDQAPAMIQALLKERFHIEMSGETKSMSVYNLVVGSKGAKLKPGDTGEQWKEGTMKGGIFRGGLELHQLNMGGLAEVLAGQVGRPVIDRTDLKGIYDVSLRWRPEEMAGGDSLSSAPSLFTALQEQLGLKLESGKADIEVFRVTRLEKPGEN